MDQNILTMKTMIVFSDLTDDEEVLGGVAIPSLEIDRFIDCVVQLAHDQFGGVSFGEMQMMG